MNIVRCIVMLRLDEKTELFRIVWERLSSFEKADWEENFLVEYTHDSTAIEGNTLTRSREIGRASCRERV